jgi:hypothetical protein
MGETMQRLKRTTRRSASAFALVALLLLALAPPAEACPRGPTLPELVLVAPIALALFPVALGTSAAIGVVSLTSGGVAFLATLPVRLHDEERANELTTRAFRAPLTALEKLSD